MSDKRKHFFVEDDVMAKKNYADWSNKRLAKRLEKEKKRGLK